MSTGAEFACLVPERVIVASENILIRQDYRLELEELGIRLSEARSAEDIFLLMEEVGEDLVLIDSTQLLSIAGIDLARR